MAGPNSTRTKKAKWCIEKLIEEVDLDEKEDNQDTIHS